MPAMSDKRALADMKRLAESGLVVMHTPTPWIEKIMQDGAVCLFGPKGVPYYEQKMACLVGREDRTGDDTGQIRADAAFILRAVNSHADMLKALERTLKCLGIAVRVNGGDPETNEACVEARAAITLARGE